MTAPHTKKFNFTQTKGHAAVTATWPVEALHGLLAVLNER